MESLNVFSQCVCVAVAVVLCSVTTVRSQDDFGSGTGVLCDVANPCTEANTVCYQVDPDADPECIFDPCKQGATNNADCNVNMMCVSAGNCGMWDGACNDIPTGSTYTCVDPCMDSVYCPTGTACTFDSLATTQFQCGTSIVGGDTMRDVCDDVDCNGMGTCIPQTDVNNAIATDGDSMIMVPICECNDNAVRTNDTYCESTAAFTANDENQVYENSVSVRVINYPWVPELQFEDSPEYLEYKQKALEMCNWLFGGFPGFLGCSLSGLREGSVITSFSIKWDHPANTEKILAEALMNNLTQRTNVETGLTENWWGNYLQIDETSITIATPSQERLSTTSSAMLPAVLGSVVAVLVIALTVVLLFYLGRVCRNRYYAGTYDDSEDTETTHQTTMTPHYWYTRNNPRAYGWGYHGQPSYWSTSPSQQQGNIRDQGDWRWTAQQRGVYTAS